MGGERRLLPHPSPEPDKEEGPMPHETGLIATISIALVVAFGGRFVATRLRLRPVDGYPPAGVG